jgi:hypothetical protein
VSKQQQAQVFDLLQAAKSEAYFAAFGGINTEYSTHKPQILFAELFDKETGTSLTSETPSLMYKLMQTSAEANFIASARKFLQEQTTPTTTRKEYIQQQHNLFCSFLWNLSSLWGVAQQHGEYVPPSNSSAIHVGETVH